MRTEFPAMHTSLERPPRSPDREKRSRKRRAALATRGVFFVRPRSERTSSLQFVATYFGRYSSGRRDAPSGSERRRTRLALRPADYVRASAWTSPAFSASAWEAGRTAEVGAFQPSASLR